MTGAPKRRSCEILRGIESNEPRGIYSGVLGYLDVGGGGDFSVVIRTAYKWDQDAEEIEQPDGSKKKFDVWRVGAGGAVTAQSTDVGEFEEMEAKRDSTLR
ncbi:para-aminobenzoate synthase, (PABA), partial [Cryomyces antarcticus]